jgi:hypothetical protein
MFHDHLQHADLDRFAFEFCEAKSTIKTKDAGTIHLLALGKRRIYANDVACARCKGDLSHK